MEGLREEGFFGSQIRDPEKRSPAISTSKPIPIGDQGRRKAASKGAVVLIGHIIRARAPSNPLILPSKTSKGNTMNSAPITDNDVELGKQTLLEVLADARMAAPLQPSLEERPSQPEQQMSFIDPYICISNLDSLVIREEDGGWFADFVLKTVPDGWPDVFGTPSYAPFATRDSAYHEGFVTVKGLLEEEAAGRRHTRPYPGEPLLIGNRITFISYDGT